MATLKGQAAIDYMKKNPGKFKVVATKGISPEQLKAMTQPTGVNYRVSPLEFAKTAVGTALNPTSMFTLPATVLTKLAESAGIMPKVSEPTDFVGKALMGISQPFRQAQERQQMNLDTLLAGPLGTVNREPTFTTKGELEAMRSDKLSPLKEAAGMASFFVPAGSLAKGAGALAKSGAISGALGGFGGSKQGEELTGTAIGGATGAAIGGLLGKLGTMGKKTGVSKLDSLRAGAIPIKGSKVGMTKPEVQKLSLGIQDDLFNRNLISSNTPTQNEINAVLPKYFDDLESDVQRVVANSDIDGSSLVKLSNKMRSLGFDKKATSTAERQLFDTLQAQQFNPDLNNSQKLLQTMRDIQTKAGGYAKIGGDSVGTQKLQNLEELRDLARSELSNVQGFDQTMKPFSNVKKVEDFILSAPEQKSMFYRNGLAINLGGAKETARVAALKLAMGATPIQESIGAAGKAFGQNKLAQQLLAPSVVGGMSGMGGVPQGETTSMEGMTPSMATTAPSMGNVDMTGIQQLKGQMILGLVNSGASTSEATKMVDNYLLAQGIDTTISAGKQLPAKQQAEMAETDSTLSNLDRIESIITSRQDLFGPVTGRISGLSGKLGLSPEAVQLNASLNMLAQNVGKQLEGGKLTDADIARYREMLPNQNDDVQSALYKLNDVRQQLLLNRQTKLASYKDAGYTTTGSSSLEDLLSNVGNQTIQ